MNSAERPRPTSRWHLDEMAVVIAGRQFWLWRAVDDEGDVLDKIRLAAAEAEQGAVGQ